MEGKVIIKCPKCKGLGGMMQIDGKQSLCPSCGNLGFIVWTIDLFIQQLFQYIDYNAETMHYNEGCFWNCDEVMRLFEEFNRKEEFRIFKEKNMFEENRFYEFIHKHKKLERFFERHSYKYRDYIIRKASYCLRCSLFK